MTEQQWDKLMQPDYVVQVYRFYGFEPAEGGAETPVGSSSGSQQDQSNSQHISQQ